MYWCIYLYTLYVYIYIYIYILNHIYVIETVLYTSLIYPLCSPSRPLSPPHLTLPLNFFSPSPLTRRRLRSLLAHEPVIYIWVWHDIYAYVYVRMFMRHRILLFRRTFVIKILADWQSICESFSGLFSLFPFIAALGAKFGECKLLLPEVFKFRQWKVWWSVAAIACLVGEVILCVCSFYLIQIIAWDSWI